jgi:hypothetical protein
VTMVADHYRAGLQTGWVRSHPCFGLLQAFAELPDCHEQQGSTYAHVLQNCPRSPWAAFSQPFLGLGYSKRCNASAGAKTLRSLSVS